MSTEAQRIGCNIRAARQQKGLTQNQVCNKADISTSQLSAYENGRQMIGLATLAKIAVALDTSIDSLYFGKPSEAFLNKTENFGETVVNCFKKLRELGVVSDVRWAHEGGCATVVQCSSELHRMFSMLADYEIKKAYYLDGEAFQESIYTSVANEINMWRS